MAARSVNGVILLEHLGNSVGARYTPSVHKVIIANAVGTQIRTVVGGEAAIDRAEKLSRQGLHVRVVDTASLEQVFCSDSAADVPRAA